MAHNLSLIHISVFEPDEGQTKELKATVDYVLGDEVQTEDHKDLTATVQILQPDTLSTPVSYTHLDVYKRQLRE